MPRCAAKRCPNSADGCPTKKRTFRFPLNDQGRLKQWIQYINRQEGWTPSKHSRLCSIHFSPDCFIHKGNATSLTSEAIPTLSYPSMYDVSNPKYTQKRKEEQPIVRTTVVTARTVFFKVADPKDVSHDHLYGIPAPANTTMAEMDVSSPLKIAEDEVPSVAVTVEVSCTVPQPSEDDDVFTGDEPTMCKDDVEDSATVTERNPPSCRQSTYHAISGQSKKNGRRKGRPIKEKLERQSKRIRRLKGDVKDLWAIVCELKEKLYISSSCDVLGTARGKLAREILLRTRASERKAPLSDDLMMFAMRLHQHSAAAYDFVRANFDHVLPNSSTLVELELKALKVASKSHNVNGSQ